MNLQVLVSAMNQTDHSILEKMNIQSDAIIINQCDKNHIEEFIYNDCKIKFLSFAERGVGLSRNNALMRATADICLFADEDVTYVDSYKEIVLQAFTENPSADIIIFNVLSTNSERPSFVITNNERVKWHNYLKYGTVRIAIRTERLKKSNVYFSLLFGAGAKYGSGEDSLFLTDCMKKRLKIYTNHEVIGSVKQEGSTWFKGYTEKYFMDKGILFYCISYNWSKLLCLQYVWRHAKEFKEEMSPKQAYEYMIKGIHSYKGES